MVSSLRPHSPPRPIITDNCFPEIVFTPRTPNAMLSWFSGAAVVPNRKSLDVRLQFCTRTCLASSHLQSCSPSPVVPLHNLSQATCLRREGPIAHAARPYRQTCPHGRRRLWHLRRLAQSARR